MLTVIFGAGASWDSIADQSAYGDASGLHQPPLASQLFAHRFGPWLEHYRQVRPIAAACRTSTETVEQVLQREADAAFSDELIAVRLMATRYYLRDVLRRCGEDWLKRCSHVSNYVELLTAIQKWQSKSGTKVCYVTFNYDRMLDDAVETVYECSLSEDISAYTGQSDFDLVKPHGSVDWVFETEWSHDDLGHRIDHEESHHFAIQNAARVSFSGDGPKSSARLRDDRVYIPAVSIPITKKDDSTFVWTEAQQAALRTSLSESSRVLLIGWAGAENHFAKLWSAARQGLPPIEIWCVDASHEAVRSVKENLSVNGVRENVIAFGREAVSDFGFSKFVRSNLLIPFLQGESTNGLIMG